MTIALLDINSSDNLFVFDVAESETKKLKIKWTDHPIEAGQNISDYGWLAPQSYTVAGAVTAWPYSLVDSGASSGVDLQRPQRILDSLETLAITRQPVVLVCKYWTKEIVIEDVSAGTDVSLLKISITFRTFTVPTIKYTDIPESRLKEIRGDGTSSTTGNKDRKNKPVKPKPGGKQTGKKKGKSYFKKFGDKVKDHFEGGKETGLE